MRHPLRLAPQEYVGRRQYLLTICTHDRQPWFKERSVVESTVSQFLRAADRCDFDLLAYCFMPDHVHALVGATTRTADLRHFVRIVKQQSGFAFKRTYRQTLWQRSYHDRTVRSDEKLQEIAHYIISNPVRAGLVTTAADYPFWGSQRYSRAELLEFAGR